MSSSNLPLPTGFVDLLTIDPSIIVNLRYRGNTNFMGRPVKGYDEDRAILTLEAAQALKNVQTQAKKYGYSLVVYHAYRGQRVSDEFKRWCMDGNDNLMQDWFYPRVNKSDLIKLGYIGERSSHSRGSTVDVTLIPLSGKLHDLIPVPRKLLDGFEILFLDDGTLDMGSSYDLFDQTSHHESNLISQECKQRREYLLNIMSQAGFLDYPEEWWHYTLRNEPFPDTYFNF